jgi:hypothetical protein
LNFFLFLLHVRFCIQQRQIFTYFSPTLFFLTSMAGGN